MTVERKTRWSNAASFCEQSLRICGERVMGLAPPLRACTPQFSSSPHPVVHPFVHPPRSVAKSTLTLDRKKGDRDMSRPRRRYLRPRELGPERRNVTQQFSDGSTSAACSRLTMAAALAIRHGLDGRMREDGEGRVKATAGGNPVRVWTSRPFGTREAATR